MVPGHGQTLPPSVKLDDTGRMGRTAHPNDMHQDTVTISPGSRLKAAMILAILADVFQLAVFPLFVEGGASPADDLVDLCVGGALTSLLGWHWEFLPSFAAKLVPGIDMVPLWTMAVANVYRKSKRLTAATIEGQVRGREPGRDPRHP